MRNRTAKEEGKMAKRSRMAFRFFGGIMRNPTLANLTFVTVLVRLLIALLLGLQLGLIVFVRAMPQSFMWSLWVPAAVLLLALFLSVLLDPGVCQGAIPPGAIRQALLKTMLSLGSPLVLALFLAMFVAFFGADAPLVLTLEVPLIAAFVVGDQHLGLAISCAVASWLGVSLPLVIAAYNQAQAPGNDLGFLGLYVIAMLVLLGFGVAALSGWLGMVLRRWALGRKPSHSGA
jgi:hypothetical protein